MRASKLLAPLVLAVGCAAQDGGERPAPPQAADAPVSHPVEAAVEERVEADAVDDELGFAEYERMLAEKEDRLRAVGVLVAAREQQRDTRYAPPPPAGGAPADEDAGAVGRSIRSKKTSSGMGGGQAPAPTRRPTTSSSRVGAQPGPDPKPAPAPKPKADAVEADAESDPQRCQTICDLSAATCDLEGKICDLAQRHPGDPRYAELCRRADEDCRVAAEACQRCTP